MKIAAICDEDTAVGLKLAGVEEVYAPKDDNETLSLINKLVGEEKNIGVLFINEELAQNISKRLYEIRLRVDVPIIVEIPGKKGRLPEYVDYISRLIKRAVGIEVYRQR
jgi:vacuolar-type H+-ATPase subunit F/Vma7